MMNKTNLGFIGGNHSLLVEGISAKLTNAKEHLQFL